MLYLYGVVRPDVLEPGAAEAAVARRPATPDAPFDAAVEQADAICSALQLINFWQDVAVDFAKDRIYLPQDDMARHGVTESDIANATVDDRWKSLMRFEIARARAMLESGAPLATRLRGRIGMELRMIVQGGRRILEKLDEAEGDVFRRRPVLGALDWPLMLIRALAM
jgi:phytoene/squalene synthetase